MRQSTRGRPYGRRPVGRGPSGRRTSGRRRKKNRGCVTAVFIIALIALIIYGGFRLYGMIDDRLAAWGNELMQRQYPVKYESVVEKYADKYDMDKYLIYAVIRTESKFDQYAVSDAGAYGLMQIQEETAADCAKKLDMRLDLPDDLYQPDINIHIGTYYLSWLLERYDGSISVAVAAYNGGIGNVDEWLKSEEYSDGSGGLDNIPFSQTAGYVEGVNSSYEKYKELYNE